MKGLLRCIFLFIISLCCLTVYIYTSFNRYVHSLELDNEQEIWSHRGVHNRLQENSLEAFQLAKEQGFKGVEIDVFYDNGKFVVSHDKPYQLVNGEILLLSQVFKQFESELFYWIDLKNINRRNKNEVASNLNEIFNGYEGLQEKVFIESGNGLALRRLSKKGLNCIYWVQFSRSQPKQFLKLIFIKAVILNSHFKGISSDFRFVDKTFRKQFKNLNWYIFTVDVQLVIDRFMRFKETTVILTDLEGKDVF